MRRDMDLCRLILLEIEKNAEEPIGWINIQIKGKSPKEISYNLQQLADAGLVEAHDLSTADGLDVRPVRLLWPGHEFLDSVRSDTIWARAKDVVMNASGGLAFELLADAAKQLVKKVISL